MSNKIIIMGNRHGKVQSFNILAKILKEKGHIVHTPKEAADSMPKAKIIIDDSDNWLLKKYLEQ